jgi:hypothetical protein
MRELPPAAGSPPGEAGEIELSGQRPPRSPRARALRLALLLLALALALAVPLGGLAALREHADALLHPTPTPRSLPGTDAFYVLPAPPWVSVWVDGRRVANPPLAGGTAAPMRLAPGTHHLEWRGAPFNTKRCTVVAPVPFIYRPGPSSCGILPYQGQPAGYVLQYRESLGALSSSQQSALLAAIGDGLRATSFTAEMPAGWPYALPQPNDSVAFQLATAPAARLATLTLTFDPNPGVTEPCALSSGFAQPCRFPDQDCRLLCTALPIGADRSAWLVAFPAHAQWSLATPDGAPAGAAADGPFRGDVLVLARVTWDGTMWHATPVFGHAAGGALADDAVCGPARDWLAGGASLLGAPFRGAGPLVAGGPLLTGEDPGGVRYVSDGNPTDGCAVSVPPGALTFAPDPAVTQPMVFLLRFGMLLAVNDAAHQVVPQLPVASDAERAIASGMLPQG